MSIFPVEYQNDVDLDEAYKKDGDELYEQLGDKFGSGGDSLENWACYLEDYADGLLGRIRVF